MESCRGIDFVPQAIDLILFGSYRFFFFTAHLQNIFPSGFTHFGFVDQPLEIYVANLIVRGK